MTLTRITQTLALLACSSLAVTATVVDQLGAPLAGVQAQYISGGASVLSAIDGSVTLPDPSPTNAHTSLDQQHIGIANGALVFSLSQAAEGSIQTYDLMGHLLFALPHQQFAAGVHQVVPLGKNHPTTGVYLVRYQLGSQNGAFTLVANGSLFESGAKIPMWKNALKLQGSVIDTVRFSKTGLVTKNIPICDYATDLGQVAMDSVFGTLVDARDGQVYKTVVIGTQTWMAQNLNIGTKVPGTASTANQSNDSLIEKYCYENVAANCVTDGGLYQWSEALGLPNVCNSTNCGSSISIRNHQGICPMGWHIPSNDDWWVLIGFLSPKEGSQMKTSTGWSVNTGTNSSGFSALPAGQRSSRGGFDWHGYYAEFWEASETFPWGDYHQLYYTSEDLWHRGSDKTLGLSVRCLKDTP